MKSSCHLHACAVIMCAAFMYVGCSPSPATENQSVQTHAPEEFDAQIAAYVRNIHQDQYGAYWLGTNNMGVARFDGDSLRYYSNAEGFYGGQITGIAEDWKGDLWFSTGQGVVKCEWSGEGQMHFVNYTDSSLFGGQQFWSICADQLGRVWAGAARGVFVFDGSVWQPFDIPYPEQSEGSFITSATSWSIAEDSKGRIWFSTNGFGVYRYDGVEFTNYTEEDGLTNNHVDCILEDSKGNMWFGTREGGISRFDGSTFINYTSQDRIGGDEVCAVFEDSSGDIWFSSEGYGVYRLSGELLTNFSEDEGLNVLAVQTIYEDNDGRILVGGGGGLYAFDGRRFVHLGKKGIESLIMNN